MTLLARVTTALDDAAGADPSAADLATSAAALLDPTGPAGTGRGGEHEALLVLDAVYTARRDPDPRRAAAAEQPAVYALTRAVEDQWLHRLRRAEPVTDDELADPVAAMRALAARDRLPGVYRWAADRADRAGLAEFLALEGGPDAGFDDLVAGCQTGLTGRPKMELARNYWDEMGDGDPAQVHTDLYARFVTATGVTAVPPAEQPVCALERSLLCSMLAGRASLRPELVGALGMVELQAGPRCRLVLHGLRRLGYGPEARDFYRVHAEVDPRHGRDWLDHAVAPLCAQRPGWAAGMLRGARWRAAVNRAFFTAMTTRFDPALSSASASASDPAAAAAA